MPSKRSILEELTLDELRTNLDRYDLEGVRLFFVGGPKRSMGLLRAARQELLDPSEAG